MENIKFNEKVSLVDLYISKIDQIKVKFLAGDSFDSEVMFLQTSIKSLINKSSKEDINELITHMKALDEVFADNHLYPEHSTKEHRIEHLIEDLEKAAA